MVLYCNGLLVPIVFAWCHLSIFGVRNIRELYSNERTVEVPNRIVD